MDIYSLLFYVSWKRAFLLRIFLVKMYFILIFLWIVNNFGENKIKKNEQFREKLNKN